MDNTRSVYRLTPFAITSVLAALVFLHGCAVQTPRSAPPKGPDATVQNSSRPLADGAVLLPSTNQRTIEKDGRYYKVVNTPFGVIKKPVDPPVSHAEPPVAQSADTGDQKPEAGQSGVVPGHTTRQVTGSPARTTTQSPQSSRSGQPPAPPAAGAAPSEGSQGVTLNFDDAELYEVIRFMAEILEINYMVDSGVRGRVTIQTAGELQRKDLFAVFLQILGANGLTAAREGAIYKITSLKEAKRLPLISYTGRKTQNLPQEQRVIMQIIPLHHILVEEMTKVATPFISAEGTIIAHAESNTLILVDKGINILKVLNLVESFDVDLFTSIQHRFYKVQHNSVDEIRKIINEIISAYSSTLSKEIDLIPITHLNMLLVLSRQEKAFERVEGLLKTLDIPNATVQSRLYVYAVKNGRADELATLLNTIFTGTSAQANTGAVSTGNVTAETGTAAKPQSGNPFMKATAAQKANQPASAPPATATGGDGQGSRTLRGELKITPDPIRNALIIEAIPSDYGVVETILQHLDVLPRQVFIEAVIAEIELGDENEFGINWDYSDSDGDSASDNSFPSATLGGDFAGLIYKIGQTGRWSATLKARMGENKANILSAPSLLASNDQEARIDISDEIPVASSEFAYTNTGSTSVIETSIEYRNTGLILSVTPHINENGLVSLELDHELSEAADAVEVGGKNYPSFKKRSVSTVLTVGHDQTIVIGGMISNIKSNVDTGVPFLRKIPLLGYFFGHTSDKDKKKELIIMITPRVITNLDDVDRVARDFKTKVSNIEY